MQQKKQQLAVAKKNTHKKAFPKSNQIKKFFLSKNFGNTQNKSYQ